MTSDYNSPTVSEDRKLNTEETATMDAAQIRMEVLSLPVLNFALQQNGMPTIREIRIDNRTAQDYYDAVIRISAAPSFCRPYQKTVSHIPANGQMELSGIDLVIDPEYLAGMTEKLAGSLMVELIADGQVLCSETVSLSILAFNEWHGYQIFPELLTAFVTPNHPDVIRITSRAAGFLEEWTGDPSLDGYQTRDTNRALQQAAAVFKALQEQNIVYAEPPASFEVFGQRVRLCDEVLSQKMGTCLDLTLFYAGCLEAIGLHPLLILQKGHIFAGVWLEEATFPESVQDDVSLLTKRIAEGTRVISVVECTLCTAGKNATFDDACRSAEFLLRSKDEVECFVDVRRARLSHISPLPVRTLTADGWKVERPELNAEDLTAAPKHVAVPIDMSGNSAQEFSKKVLWERKLLDLGLRNTLLNMRLTKTMIPLLSSSLDDLEDALAAGRDYSIKPRPLELQGAGGKVGFESLHIVDGYSALLQSEFRDGRLRSALSETDLANAMKNLYRAARTDMEENGANTLYMALGLLKWYETDRSTQARYAPLLLLPIEMVRKSAAEGYIIRLRDDEAQMNITLLEKLRQDFSIEIKGLDPLPMDNKGVDTRRVFAAVRNGIMDQKRWDVLESACLGIFSFSQFVMWNDIHNRAEDLARSKVVRSLMENQLTWQAEDMQIEGQVPEDKVLLPIPADASQLYAIESAGEGKSFVLHGPPGTGKSQTITALIANTLAQGKTVLFVAEKMAALEVVQKRLKAIGLAPFCMELHSNKAKKKDVLEQLRQASEVTKYRSSGEYAASVERIGALRKDLNSYAAALHRRQKCGMTLFVLLNEYQAYKDAPDIGNFSESYLSGVSEAELYDLEAAVDRLVSAGRAVGSPHNHPLSAVRCKTYSQQLRRIAAENAENYKKSLAALEASVSSFASAIGQTTPSGFDEIGLLVQTAQFLCELESYPHAWVEREDAEAYLSRVITMTEHYQNADYKRNLLTRWTEEFLELDGASLSESYRQQSTKWFLGKMIGMRKFRKQFSSLSKVELRDDMLGQDLADLAAYQAEKRIADAMYSELGNGLGTLNRGEDTQWKQVSDLATAAINTLKKPRLFSNADRLRIAYGTDPKAIGLAHNLSDTWGNVFQARSSLFSALELEAGERENWISTQTATCDLVSAHADELREWVLWNKAAADAEEAGLGPVVQAYRNGLDYEMVKPAFKKALTRGLSIMTIEADDALNMFSGADFNSKVEQFRKIDGELTEPAKSEIYCRLAAQVPNFTTASIGSSETGILQRAIRSGGRGTSIRRLFEQIPNLLPKLCPCLLMSPISVAQYLDPNRKPFDLVVFDEASQLPTSKAIGALARGENAIIVGDPKQMPPTSFFASSTTDEDHLEEEDMESILDDCLALNMPQTHLLWHYRSRHESLIAFSNSQFYENKLYTFPSVNDRESHVRLIHVDGVFERGGKRINRQEAEAVIEELKRRCHDPSCRERSVGVVTFNISQQNLIDDLLTDACKEDSELEEWAYNSKEPIFIKNLENVQGDERDVILFSIGYGPDQSGKVTMNFGPLNRDGGWRRLNVAVSRARYEMLVFATLTPDQINLSRTSAAGVAALKKFMEFAAGEHLAENENTAAKSIESYSGIADAICDALQQQGYETDKAIGESAYKIDIGVIDPHNPEKYLLGILLDGAGYKTAQTTRDREIAQVSVLRGLGWRITRVWSMDWWDNSGKEIERLIRELHAAEQAESDIHPVRPERPADVQKIKAESEPAAQPDNEPKLKGVVESLPQQKKQVVTYRNTQLPLKAMTAETFVDPYRGNRPFVVERVKYVLEQEGPISESLLTRRVVQSFSIARSGSRIQQYMAGIYKSLGLKTTVQAGEKVYWKASQDPLTYAEFRANGEGDNKRDAKEIPIQEAANAVCRALDEHFSLAEEDLVRAAANLMGITRIGTGVNALFLGAISWAHNAKRIRQSDNGKWMLNQP